MRDDRKLSAVLAKRTVSTGAPWRRTFVLLGSVVLAIGLLAIPAGMASAAEPAVSGDSITSTGAGGIGPNAYTPPAALRSYLDAKVAAAHAVSAQLRARVANGVSPDCSGPAGCAPTSYSLPNLALHKEGEGDGKKSYTCGPAATRNMVQTMTGADHTEATFASWEHTTQANGTYIGDIAAALNNHFSDWGGWDYYYMSSAVDLEGYVISDTSHYHQGVIEHIDTEYLSFFNHKKLGHYDLIYGYSASGATINIAEEWDPVYIYGSSSYGDPYGTHGEAVSNVYNAIHNSNSGSIVA